MYLLEECDYCLSRCFWFVIQNHYQVLQLSRNCAEVEIKQAYKRLSLQWHPDKWSSFSEEEQRRATEMFQRVGEAKSVLLESRQSFDEQFSKATFVPDDPLDFNVPKTSPDYKDDQDIRKAAAMKRFYEFYTECVLCQQRQQKSFRHLFVHFAIPAAISWMCYQSNGKLPVQESVLSAWITLVVFNKDGYQETIKSLSVEEKQLLDAAIAVLLKNDSTY